MKIVLNLIGCVAVALGVLGIFLPLLPTTPFLLLASACFARGSSRLHNWLQTNRVFGKYLRDYENGKGIPLRGKVWILVFMWGSMSYSIWRTDMLYVRILIILVGCCVTIYLTRFVPTMRRPASRLAVRCANRNAFSLPHQLRRHMPINIEIGDFQISISSWPLKYNATLYPIHWPAQGLTSYKYVASALTAPS
jgi:uncharacterized protein